MAVFIKYDPLKFHDEKCEFEFWDGAVHKMAPCGVEAYGQRGARVDSRICLCREHFDMATANLHSSQIKDE